MTEDEGRGRASEPSGLERLRRFLETEMAMSHVYQPIMIRTMLEGGGAATRRQIAAAFLGADLSQLEYYENVVTRYPGPVLRRRGIVELERGVYRLARDLRRMDEWQRASLSSTVDLFKRRVDLSARFALSSAITISRPGWTETGHHRAITRKLDVIRSDDLR